MSWEYLDVVALEQYRTEATLAANTGPYEKQLGPVLRRYDNPDQQYYQDLHDYLGYNIPGSIISSPRKP